MEEGRQKDTDSRVVSCRRPALLSEKGGPSSNKELSSIPLFLDSSTCFSRRELYATCVERHTLKCKSPEIKHRSICVDRLDFPGMIACCGTLLVLIRTQRAQHLVHLGYVGCVPMRRSQISVWGGVMGHEGSFETSALILVSPCHAVRKRGFGSHSRRPKKQ